MGSCMCLCARAEDVLEIWSATLDIHLDLDDLGKHHEHFGACNLGGWSLDELSQKELGRASSNRPRHLLCLPACLRNTCRNRTHLCSKIVKPHTEAQGGAVLHGVPKFPASVTFHLLSGTLDAVDVLPMFAPHPQRGGIQ